MPSNDSSVLKPRIEVWYADGTWHARSDDPRQGSIGGTAEIAAGAVSDWIDADMGADAPSVVTLRMTLATVADTLRAVLAIVDMAPRSAVAEVYDFDITEVEPRVDSEPVV